MIAITMPFPKELCQWSICKPLEIDVHLLTLLEGDCYVLSEVAKLHGFLTRHTSHIIAGQF